LRLLLDTQVVLWSVNDETRLGPKARDVLADLGHELLVSIVSIWEIALTTRVGKLDGDIVRLLDELPALSIQLLELRPAHLLRLVDLPRPTRHRDPFDQLLLAQAAAESATFVTADRALAAYGTELMDAGA